MNTNIGENIKRIRKEKRLTQKQLGEKCTPPMQDSAIRRYESGKSNPTLETIKRIAEALEVTELHITSGMTDEEVNEAMRNSRKRYAEFWNENRYEIQIKRSLNVLNKDGKQKAVEQVEMLTKIPEYRKEQEKPPEE